jgi:hypothetical protein
VVAGLSLTFDRFRQDQMVLLCLDEKGDGTSAGLVTMIGRATGSSRPVT